jgi:hypothetical protein
MVIDTNGDVFLWGSNSNGQLGDGTTTQRNFPYKLDTTSGVVSGKTFVDVCAGQYHSWALANDGNVYGWGDNAIGKIGDGTTTQRLTPVLVDNSLVITSSNITVVGLYCGFKHSMEIVKFISCYGKSAYSGGLCSNNGLCHLISNEIIVLATQVGMVMTVQNKSLIAMEYYRMIQVFVQVTEFVLVLILVLVILNTQELIVQFWTIIVLNNQIQQIYVIIKELVLLVIIVYVMKIMIYQVVVNI